MTALGLLAWLAVSLIAGPQPSLARLVIPADRSGPDATPTLQAIESAVLSADHRQMADLLSPEGVRLALGPDAQRSSQLTPSQAHYYFKNLFQKRRTLRFAFQKHQTAEGGRTHALALWHFDSPETGGETQQRLMFTLEHEPSGWKVTEIAAWR